MNELLYEFLNFQLWPDRRRLEFAGESAKLSDREFDVLVVLVERQGTLVTANEIKRLVWPREHVADGIVRVRIAQLRKKLSNYVAAGEIITTVVGSGYMFLPTVHRTAGTRKPDLRLAKPPSLLGSVIGRDAEIAEACRSVKKTGCLVISGPGGIGKTTVAIAVAMQLSKQFEDGIVFVDLASTREASLVSSAIASALGSMLYPDDPISGIAHFLRSRGTMLILDTCEHVAEGVRSTVARLNAEAPHSSVICTSRESVRVSGAIEMRLNPLSVPPAEVTAAAAIRMHSSVRLFVERATASSADFHLDQNNAVMVAGICRSLDGVPLALEFAASRIGDFGIAEVFRGIGQPLATLATGRRTSISRHRTLRDTLQWSYDYLRPQEKSALRALSIFEGRFSELSAGRILGKNKPFRDTINRLVSKSLLTRLGDGGSGEYRLLDMTRDFGRQALFESGEFNVIAERHASDALLTLEQAEAEFKDGLTINWKTAYSHRIADIREALNRCFREEGDVRLGIEIVAAASVLFTPLGMLAEYGEWLRRAIAANQRKGTSRSALDAKLYTALGTVLFHAEAHKVEGGARDAFLAAARAAGATEDRDSEMRAWSAYSACLLVAGNYNAAMDLQKEFAKIPGGSGSLVEHRTLAHSKFYAGRLDEALNHIGAVLHQSDLTVGARSTRGAQHDPKQATLRATLANHAWLSGFPNRAFDLATESIADAIEVGNMVSFCQVIAMSALPIAHFLGDGVQAEELLAELLKVSSTHSILLWLGWAGAYKSAIDPSDQLEPGRLAAPYFAGGALADYLATLGSAFAPSWAVIGSSRGNAGWCRAEVMRVRCERNYSQIGDRRLARLGFTKAFDEATKLGTKIWLPRIATSLATLDADNGLRLNARSLLEEVLDDLSDDLDTPDTRSARALLRTLS